MTLTELEARNCEGYQLTERIGRRAEVRVVEG